MKDDSLYRSLVNICGSRNVSNDPNELIEFSKDMSFYNGKVPKIIIYLSKTNQIEEVVKLQFELN